jgi:5-bromo-4-chloroindolyl phosphate hydrolysis protein
MKSSHLMIVPILLSAIFSTMILKHVVGAKSNYKKSSFLAIKFIDKIWSIKKSIMDQTMIKALPKIGS